MDSSGVIHRGADVQPGMTKLAAHEAVTLEKYPEAARNEMLKDWRNGALTLEDGLLVTPRARREESAKVAQILDTYAVKKERQHRKAVESAKRRKDRRHGR